MSEGLAYTSVPLPSRGEWYGGKVPGGVVGVRRTTGREDLVLDSGNLTVMDRIHRLVQTCTQFPDPTFTANDLLVTDRMVLALAIRSATYGPEYDFTYACANPNCRTENTTRISFGSAELIERTPDVIRAENPGLDLTEPFPFKLPVDGSTITIRHLRVSDDDAIASRTKNDALLKAHQSSLGGADMSPLVQFSQRVVTVNGETWDNIRKDNFYLSLSSKDLRAIRKFSEKFETGVRLLVTRSCAKCHTEQKVGVPLSLATFRGESDSE